MNNFLAGHFLMLMTLVAGGLVFAIRYFVSVYDRSDRRRIVALTVQFGSLTAIASGALIYCRYIHAMVPIILVCGLVALACLRLTLIPVLQLLKTDADHPLRKVVEPEPMVVGGIAPRYERFGEYELIQEPDRLLIRRHASPDGRSWYFLIFVSVSTIIRNWNNPTQVYTVAFFLLPVLSYLGGVYGEMLKQRRLRTLLEVRGDRIVVDGSDWGTVSSAKIDVDRGFRKYFVRLIDGSSRQPCEIVKMPGKTLYEAEEMAEAIREYLKLRQSEQVWPPAPVGMEAAL